jgi:muramoyltetrapeptide carboxypeptidase
MRLLPDLDLDLFRQSPRLFVGFSDATALHAVLVDRVGLATIHGPVVTSLSRVGSETRERLHNMLFEAGPAGEYGLEKPVALRGGRASGPVKGGNLSVLTRLLGTPHMPDLAGAVLFLEDVGERPYRIDRMLTHLRLSGVLARVAAILLGDFEGCEEPNAEPGHPTAMDVLRERLSDLGVPVLAGFPAGHGKECVPLPLGLRLTVDATEGRLVFEEGFAAP